MSELKLGSGGKMGQVNLGQLKGGVKKTKDMDESQKAIFDKFDKNKDGVLDESEMQALQQGIQDAAHDDTFGNREMRKFLKKNDMKNLKKEDLAKFINNLSQSSDNIESYTNNNGNVTITYKDGSSETIYPDKSRDLTTIGENGEQITEHYVNENRKNGVRVVDTDGNTQNIELDDNGNPKCVVETPKEGRPVVTTNYENGEPASKIKKDGSTTEKYVYDENGKPVLTSKVENEGILAKEKITNYNYNQDGTVTATITEAGKQTIQTIVDDVIQNETITENGKTTERKYNENGYTEISEDGAVQTQFTSDGKKLSQTKTVDGQTYSVEYDGEGNTKGIIVQNGESPAMIAKKFGCSVEDLLNANPELVKGKGNNKYFLVGEEIKIPKELEADDKALQGRATRQEAIQGYTDFMEAKAAKEAAEAAAAEAAQQAEQDAAEAAAKNEHRAQMQKQGKEIANDLYDDMDGIGTRKTFDQNIKRITSDNVVEVIQGYQQKSPNESLAEAIFDEAGMSLGKRKDAVRHIFNQLIARAEAEGVDVSQAKAEFENAMKLPHGHANNEDFDPIFNTLCAAINGKSVLTKAEKAEIANTPAEQLQNDTKTLLNNTADNAQESLNNQLAQDGWAADLAEGISYMWNSKNISSKVQKDIDAYKAQISELNSTKSEAEFKTKFKEIFGVDYDPQLVKAYQKRQEQLPLAEATHGIEQNFNKTMAELLKSDQLTGRSQYIQTSSFGTGTYQQTATKEQVYNENLDKFAEFIGQGNKADGLAQINQFFADSGLSENASLEDKFKAMHELAKGYSDILHANTMEATEGKGYETFKTEAESAYKAAFGLKNDIAKRVSDYNISQQTGDMVVKGVVKGGAAIGLALIPGVGLAAAAIGTAAISATVDVTDRMSSDVGLKDGEIGEILKNAAIDGASVYAGGKLTQMLANAKTFTQIGGQMLGDVATGAAAEKLQTGQITLGGVMFQCVFSGAGNLIALKNMGKAPKGTPDSPQVAGQLEAPKAKSAGELPQNSGSAGEKRNPNAGDTAGNKANAADDAPRSNGAEHADATGQKREAGSADNQKRADEAGSADNANKAEDAKRAEDARKAEEAKKAEEARRAEEARKAEEAKKAQEPPKSEFDNMKRSDLEHEMASLDSQISAQRKTHEFAQNFKDITDLKTLRLQIARMGEINDTNVRRQMNELNKALQAQNPPASPAFIKMKNNELRKALNDAANVDVSAQTARLAKLQQAYIQKTSSEMSDKIANLADGQEFSVNVARKDYPDVGFPPKAGGDSQVTIKRENGRIYAENVSDRPLKINGQEIPKGQKVELGENATITFANGSEMSVKNPHAPKDAPNADSARGQHVNNDSEPNAAGAKRDADGVDNKKQAEEARRAEDAQKADEAKKAEEAKRAQEVHEAEARRTEQARRAEEARRAEQARANAKAQGVPTYDNPRLNKYTRSANNGQAVNVTKNTYKQIDDYVENIYKEELAQLKYQYPKADKNTLKMEARMRAEQARPQTPEDIEHFAWIKERKDLFGDKMKDWGCWSAFEADNQKHGPWKMHMFSIDENDWRDMCDVIIPYLKEHDIDWKTFNVRQSATCLNGSAQQGKAFTIYPRDNAHMAQVAKDLEYIIKMNKLNKQNTHIAGDRQMGDSGRLFYRYEFNSGSYADEILDLSNKTDRQKYHSRYDSNRGGNQYLARDMSLEDDIWYNFDPSDPNAQPMRNAGKAGRAQGGHKIPRDGKLERGQAYELGNASRIRMANFNLNLNDPNIQRALSKLPEGGQVTIGREGNIRIPDKYGEVSRIHIILTKRNGKIYITDQSSNGTQVLA